ncbi:Gfo/Idh/MocA family oxidoreductase [soil metagenome]
MNLDIKGQLSDRPRIRAGFIGCGSHAFRNLYPTFQFAPVELVATCDLNVERAKLFARQFGALNSYGDYREMLEKETLDAVFIVTNYDEFGRPNYCRIAKECLQAGKHVWTEKPPAATTKEIEDLAAVAGDRNVMVGFKKMFFTANEKAHELINSEAFGHVTMATLQYPQHIPTVEEFATYASGKRVEQVLGFLDHLCHPVSLLLYLMGMPAKLYYERTGSAAGAATFTYADGRVATTALLGGAALNGGMERTTLLSSRGGQVVVDNNLTVTYHRDAPGRSYGGVTSSYLGEPSQTSAVWQPEFSLGQLYNKGLFLLGYFGEVNEFANSILEKRRPTKCHLEHAWQVTRIFEAFAEGPGKVIKLSR